MKRVLSTILALALCLSMCLCLSACDNNKDKYIGVWECKHSEPKDYSEYMYLYKDGTGEYYIVKKTFSYHYNAFSWDVEDGYLVISRSSETDIKYTLSGNKLIDKKGAVRWQKFGDDTTVVPLS